MARIFIANNLSLVNNILILEASILLFCTNWSAKQLVRHHPQITFRFSSPMAISFLQTYLEF